MAVKKYMHKSGNFEVKVEARFGKPVVCNKGMITLNKPYKQVTRLDAGIFHDKFMEVVA